MPVHTAPNPKAWAANNRFWVAADASCIQKSRPPPSMALSISPHTTIANGAVASMDALGLAEARDFSTVLSVTTKKCHGCLFIAVGAAIAAFSIFSILSFSIVLFSYVRILVRVAMLVSTASSGLDVVSLLSFAVVKCMVSTTTAKPRTMFKIITVR